MYVKSDSMIKRKKSDLKLKIVGVDPILIPLYILETIRPKQNLSA